MGRCRAEAGRVIGEKRDVLAARKHVARHLTQTVGRSRSCGTRNIPSKSVYAVNSEAPKLPHVSNRVVATRVRDIGVEDTQGLG